MTHAGLLYFLQADIKTMMVYMIRLLFFLRKGATLDINEFTGFSRKPTSVLKRMYKKAVKL